MASGVGVRGGGSGDSPAGTPREGNNFPRSLPTPGMPGSLSDPSPPPSQKARLEKVSPGIRTRVFTQKSYARPPDGGAGTQLFGHLVLSFLDK